MNESTFYLPMGKLPLEVIGNIKSTVASYSVGLVILDSGDNYSTVASGTFVSLHGCPAILTARHVIDAVKYNLGLVLTDYQHKFVLQRRSLEFACALKGDSESSGPDLGVIYIHQQEPMLGTIRAIKSFFNLDYHADLVHNKKIDILDTMVWAVSGIPAELSNINLHQQTHFAHVYLVPNPDYFQRDGYDYYEFDFRSPHPGRVPSSLGGMSGGGVWHARVLHNSSNNKVYIPEDSDWLILLGVNYCERPFSGGGIRLYTHGPESIYVKLDELAQSCSNNT